MKISGIFILLILIAGSCKNTTEKYIDKGIEYLNYVAGNLREYDMDSIAYDWASGKIKRFHFLVKEKVVDTFTDLSGKISLRIEQFISRDTGKNYIFYSLQSIHLNEYGFQRVEENQRYVKLAFPINSQRKWDGNIYNNLGYNEYRITGMNIPFANSYYSIPDNIEVTAQNDSTFISSYVRKETFGKGFGLVYKYKKEIDYDSNGQPQGFIVIWNLRKLWP